jgi:KDO2-lipid IV(A) lauroyltransferase
MSNPEAGAPGRARAPRRKPSRVVAQFLEAAGLRAVSAGFCLLPHAAAVHVGDFLGRVVARVAPLRGRVADENLAAAFPDWTPAERSARLGAMYRHLGRMLAEFLRAPVLSPARIDAWTIVEGEEHLARAREAGNGALVLSGHLGNWEWLAAAAAARGYPLDLLVAPQRNERVQAFITRCRAGLGVGVFLSKRERHELRELLKRLATGRVLGTLVDQDAGPGGAFVPFFGRPASAATGPFRMALRANATVLPVFTWREGLSHRMVVEPPLVRSPDLDDDAQARAWAAEFHARLEARIRAHPEQWFWVHRRWRSRPPAAAGGAP